MASIILGNKDYLDSFKKNLTKFEEKADMMLHGSIEGNHEDFLVLSSMVQTAEENSDDFPIVQTGQRDETNMERVHRICQEHYVQLGDYEENIPRSVMNMCHFNEVTEVMIAEQNENLLSYFKRNLTIHDYMKMVETGQGIDAFEDKCTDESDRHVELFIEWIFADKRMLQVRDIYCPFGKENWTKMQKQRGKVIRSGILMFCHVRQPPQKAIIRSLTNELNKARIVISDFSEKARATLQLRSDHIARESERRTLLKGAYDNADYDSIVELEGYEKMQVRDKINLVLNVSVGLHPKAPIF